MSSVSSLHKIMKRRKYMFKIIGMSDLFENDKIIVVEVKFETNNGVETEIDIAVKDNQGEISNIITVC